MPKFLFAYHGAPQFKSKEEGEAHMVKWKAWTASLGDALIDPGMPLGPSKTVDGNGTTDDGGPNPLAGISVVEAENMEAALAMAAPCPHISAGGSIEVAPVMDMQM